MGLKEEQELKMKYLLVTEDFEGMQIVKLTTDNVAKVEAMIMTDSGYAKSGDVNAGPTYKKNGNEDYPGSTAYWMTQLKNEIEVADDSRLKVIISHAVAAVDKENSTHINSDGVGREQLTDRIFARVVRLKETLSNFDTGVRFIEDVAAITDVSKKNEEEKKKPKKEQKHYVARTNLSFASKFAHYACLYLFGEDDANRDNFSIYDNVLNKALPIYVKKYGLDGYYSNSYSSYYKCIERIIEKCGEPLSRNGFDHLVWYYYKARLDSINVRDIKRSRLRVAKLQRKKECTPMPSVSTNQIYEHIKKKIEKARKEGKSDILVTAGGIEKELGICKRTKMVCAAMRKLKNKNDEEFDVPPRGNGTRVKIKYHLK